MFKNSNIVAYQNKSISGLSDELIDMDRWQNMLQNLSQLYSAPTIMINQANDTGVQVLATNQGENNRYSNMVGKSISADVNIYCNAVIKEDAPLYVEDASKDQRWRDNPEYSDDNFVSYYGLPLKWPDGRTFGSLCVMDHQPTHYNDLLQKLLFDYKNLIEFELELIEKNDQLQSLSVLDEHTQLLNRRGGLDAGARLMSLADRLSCDLAVIFIDLDGLKTVNDSFGHKAGDKLIELAAQCIKANLRNHDIALRYGGDEFCALVLLDEKYEADHVIDRLYQSASATYLAIDDKEFPLEFSMGVSVGRPKSTAELEEMVYEADSKMYENKHKKKNNFRLT